MNLLEMVDKEQMKSNIPAFRRRYGESSCQGA